MSGTFSANDIDYPAGWYMRNPPASGYRPYSHNGAIIFVKLWQMSMDDDQQVAIDTQDHTNWQQQDDRDVCVLFSSTTERVRLQRLAANRYLFTTEIAGGIEILVIEGELIEGKKVCERGSWVRLSIGVMPPMNSGEKGVTIYLKTGHLAQNITLPTA